MLFTAPAPRLVGKFEPPAINPTGLHLRTHGLRNYGLMFAAQGQVNGGK